MFSSCGRGWRVTPGTHSETGGRVFPSIGEKRKCCNRPTKNRNCSCRASGSPRHWRFPTPNGTRNSVFFSSTFSFVRLTKLASGLKLCGSGHKSACRWIAYKFAMINESFGIVYSRTRVSHSAEWAAPAGTMDTKRCTSQSTASVKGRSKRSAYCGSRSRPICSRISVRTLSWIWGKLPSIATPSEEWCWSFPFLNIEAYFSTVQKWQQLLENDHNHKNPCRISYRMSIPLTVLTQVIIDL